MTGDVFYVAKITLSSEIYGEFKKPVEGEICLKIRIWAVWLRKILSII